ncbi:MAG: phenylalanine--tRNA ligase subunit beta [Anaerolineae bacterium]
MTVIRVPLSWLNDFVDVRDLDPVELAERLTLAGLEVEHIRWIGLNPSPRYHVPPERMGEADGLPWQRDKLFVGEILNTERHPDADRLLLATVEYGGPKPMTIITGAPNLHPGDRGLKIAFATVGARLLDPYADEYKTTVLKAGKIRGIQSEGMACSERELGISEEHEGIILLPADAPVGMPLADYLGDAVLEMDLTPNLARDLNIIGVAREVAALYQRPLKRTQPELAALAGIIRPEDMPRPQPPAEPFARIVIEDPDLCPRYTATLIRDVQIGPSPHWVQDRLRKAGVRPISNVVDATNYVMLEWGQPTHAFDYDKLVQRAEQATDPSTLPTIIMRRAREGETMTTLDGVERKLTRDMLMITDTLGPIAVGGVMGGLDTEVSDATRHVLLEAASFDYINNRRTSQALRLPSEATARFSKGISPEMVVPGGHCCARLMSELAGGVVVEGVIDAYPLPQQSAVVAISAAEVERILGMAVPVEQVTDILQRLEFGVTRTANEELRVTAPWFRLDVAIPADLIEEIVRIIGYDTLPTTLMDDALPPQWRNWTLEGRERVRTILAAAGLQDSISYALIGADLNRKLLAAQSEPAYAPLPAQRLTPASTDAPQLPLILNPAELVRLENPLTPQADRLRSTLTGSMALALAGNLRTVGRVALFEIGKVFWPVAGEMLPDEPEMVGLALAGPREAGAWLNRNDDLLDFFDMKGVVEELLDRQGLLAEVRFEPLAHPLFGPRAATVLLRGEAIGAFGELHPAVRNAFDLPDQRAVVGELRLAPLVATAAQRRTMQPLSNFPAVKEDLAILVDESVTAEQVEQAIRQGGGNLLRAVTLFDVYRGKQVPAGKKSLAYALTYQADDKTLKDADIEKVRRRIVARLAQTVNAELRS